MSAHSPLPWREYSLRNFTRLLDANGEIVATIRHEKDASMVVKAVNNHEKLVSLLRRAYDAIMTGNGQARTAEDIHITLATLMDERP